MFRQFDQFVYVDYEKTVAHLDSLFKKLMFVKSLHARHEASMLYELAAGWHDDAEGYVLELGRFCGASTITLATALSEHKEDYSTLYSIDTNQWRWEGQIITQLGLHRLKIDNVVQILGSDLDFLRQFWNLPIRMVFIDSEHTYEHVKSLAHVCFPKVVSGGWMVFHDYDEGQDEIVKAVNEFIDCHSDAIKIYQMQSSLIVNKL